MIDGTQYTISKSPHEDPQYGYHMRTNDNTGEKKVIRSGRRIHEESIGNDVEDIRHYGCAYSKARSGFPTQAVKSSTTQQLDAQKYEADDINDFTSVKQLLVDIDAQDNAEWMRITKTRNPTPYEEFKHASKGYRFENAFNSFFDEINFLEIDQTDPSEKVVLFEKHGHRIPVDNLSTGEKQIVFRGAHLLKNLNSITNGIVLIDEPELSMHPRWQQKVLSFYRELFTKDGMQHSQIILATHSEYVLRSAFEDRNNVLIITLNDNNGTIEAKKITAPSILPSITAAETNYLAFDVVSSDYHIELYGYLQNKTGNITVKNCDDYISRSTFYNPAIHSRPSSHGTTTYQTLPTYIRNAIDHPDPTRTFSQDDLRCSIELLINLCK